MFKRLKIYGPALALVIALGAMIRATAFPTVEARIADDAPREIAIPNQSVIDQINAWYAKSWEAQGFIRADVADDLTVLRRLSLALHGTIPSLEEIRRFEADRRPQRLALWCREMLNDSRYGDYFAERLTRAFVGTQQEPFLVFRRDRFKNWIAEQIQDNRPYDEMIREMIAREGLWTGEPATNFVTHAVNDGDIDENKLAGKTVRAVLGQRIDCAQCHDHPFADWKQQQFEQLAAFYGQTRISPFGIADDPDAVYSIEDTQTLEDREVSPAVPFNPEWKPDQGTRRERLATWCTSPDNRRFARAAVNRIWAQMFGKAWSEGAPYYARIDDLPDPEPDAASDPIPLDMLADAFVKSGFDVAAMVQTIAALDVFRLSSITDVPDDELKVHVDNWAVFPLVRLRPEQIVGSMMQATSIKTLDQNSHLLTRTLRLINENDFLNEYGDLGAEEFEERSGTVPQALLRMNGRLFGDSIKPNPLNATPRIAIAAGSPEVLLETCFLTCLSRRPNADEARYFLDEWMEDNSRKPGERAHDLYWILINSPEFSWNH